MDNKEFEQAASRLDFQHNLRDILSRYAFGDEKSEGVDTQECIELMGEAYTRLATGVHENVQAWSNGQSPLLRKVVTPTMHINGEVAATKTEFLTERSYALEDKQPDYVETYVKVRDAVYEELVEDAMDRDDFDTLLDLITTYQESTLARRLWDELHARRERYPDLIAGDANMILNMIDSTNRRIDDMRHSTRDYAIEVARRMFREGIRKDLLDEETGVVKAAMLGVKLKLAGPKSKRKWVRELVEKELMKIMKKPSVPEQLIDRERAGLPITDDLPEEPELY